MMGGGGCVRFGRVGTAMVVGLVSAVGAAGCAFAYDFDAYTSGNGGPGSSSDEAGSGGLVDANAPDGSGSSSGSSGGATDDGGTGTGRSGPLDVTGDQVVNAYAALASAVTQGATSLAVDDASGFDQDDAILVLQSTGLASSTAGAAGPLDLMPTGVGRFEIARVASRSGSTLTLAAPLASAYPAQVTQVIRVPEYTDVTIHAGGTIHAQPWNGSKGGVVVLFASGKVHNDGVVQADAAGFRGARGILNASPATCPGMEGTPDDGHGPKGEGPYVAGFTAVASGAAVGGRGNHANAGGGGSCHNSGGGGGGHGGAGGVGGRSGTFTNEDPVGGMGGASLAYDPFARLVFGGGGGGGDADSSQGGPAVDGGAGGGVVFVRAASLEGSGTIHADGESGALVTGNGGGGGGAGGLVVVDVVSDATCSQPIHASGGDGSSVSGTKLGTAGGGAGGRVTLRAATISCALAAAGGQAGTQGDATAIDGAAHGAAAGSAGTTAPVVR
jgi:hypothetical protein